MSILLSPNMKLQEDFATYEARKRARVWAMQNIVMGIVLFCFGVFFFVYREFGINPFRTEPGAIDYVIGAMFVLYGGFRIYRGVKAKRA